MRIAIVVAGIGAFAAIAPAATAQLGGGNNKPPPIDSVKLAEAKAMDLENPIPFVLAHSTRLRLTADQSTRMAALQGELSRQNQDLRDRIDSIEPPGTSTRIGVASLTPAQRDSIIQTRKAIADTRGQIHDNSRHTRDAALALLTPEQQQALTELEREMRNTIEDATYGSRNGDGGAAGSRGRGGGGGGGSRSPY
jgi:hypothetical protein